MIVLYTQEKNGAIENLVQSIGELLPKWPLVLFNCLVSLEKRLRRPHTEIGAIVINVNSADEMRKINDMRHLLSNMRTILILPSRNKDIIGWAHDLFPRFIDYIDDGCKNTGLVMRKMIGPGQPLWFPKIK